LWLSVGFYVPLPQGSDQSERQRLGQTEEERAARFKAWRRDQQQQANIPIRACLGVWVRVLPGLPPVTAGSWLMRGKAMGERQEQKP
jgi:hypothetical protein